MQKTIFTANILSTLKSLEKTSKTFWNISHKTGIFLNLLIKNRKYKKILEIGTSNGYSGIFIAEALTKTNGRLYTMESHKKSRFFLAQKNFKRAGLTKNITQILGHAPEDIPKTPKFFDMAFFDATKHEHLSYFQAIKNRIKTGGIIITDNIISHKKQLTPYIDFLQSKKNWHSQILNIGTGLMLSTHIKT